MAGESPADRLSAHLSRLLGHAVSPDQPFILRSVHRAALASWSRRENIAVRLDAAAGGAPVTPQILLGQGDSAPAATTATAPPVLMGEPMAPGGLRIGIDIEEVDQLPHADDYRGHPFYQDHFTPAELSHAIRQADTRASLCGIWAAKEAIVKSGLLATVPDHLREIEITHGAAGQPMMRGCQLSISHTPRTAVAVCIAGAIAPPPGPVPQAAISAPEPPPPARGLGQRRVAAALVGAIAIAIAGGLSLAAHAWP
jgi:phosphopantetheine--protein transferase-like protein